ncbi:hypothetical protein BASA62_003856 [Batrachochytrium salamandrivorans]|nr:hypothetical protein BASA62_003856 [Batrachochytrium salamandrivorans]
MRSSQKPGRHPSVIHQPAATQSHVTNNPVDTFVSNRASNDPFALLPPEFTIGPVRPSINQPHEQAESVVLLRLNPASDHDSQSRSTSSSVRATEEERVPQNRPSATRRTMGFAAVHTTNKGQGNGRDQAMIGTLGRTKKLTHPERHNDVVNILASDPVRRCGPWNIFVVLSTCCIPSFLLSRFGGMHDKAVQRAWREKVALCWVAFFMCILLAFITFGLQTITCTRDVNSVDLDDFHRYSASTYPHRYSIHGSVYDLSTFLKTHASIGALPNSTTTSKIESSTGLDISNLFPVDPSPQCAAIIGTSVLFPCTTSDFPLSHCHPSSATDSILARLRVGSLKYDWSDLNANTTQSLLVYRGRVLDVRSFLTTNSQLIGPQATALLKLFIGHDATKAVYDARITHIIECVAAVSTVGSLSSETTGCLAADVILYISLVIIGALIMIRFVLAMLFSWFISRKLGRLQEHDKDRRLSRRVKA